MQQDAVDFATQALEKYDSWREQVNFQWNNYEVHFVIDQHD
jgi:hypothetical protein